MTESEECRKNERKVTNRMDREKKGNHGHHRKSMEREGVSTKSTQPEKKEQRMGTEEIILRKGRC